MKKITLVLAVMLCFITAMKAQTFVTYFPKGESMLGIPGYFTNNGHTHIVRVNIDESIISNCSVYDNDFTTYYLDFDGNIDLDGVLHQYYDLSNLQVGGTSIMPLIFTQNLFNSDDQYEYVEVFETGWNIKSTNGSIIYTIHTDEGYWTREEGGIMKIDDIFYLFISERSVDYTDSKVLIYYISQAQGLTKVDMELPISVFPTMPSREEQITVELGEETNASEITVVNSLGQVVKRVPVEEGQRTVTIPASELGGGLNVVNARNGQSQGSCKIIVR